MPSRGIEIYQYPCTADAGGLPPPLVGLPSIEWVFDQSNLGPDLSAIARRIDLSDNGNDFTQTTESLKPTVQTAIWATKAVFYDGVDDTLVGNNVAIGTGPLTLAWVGYCNTGTATGLIHNDAIGNQGRLQIQAGGDLRVFNGTAWLNIANGALAWPTLTKAYGVVLRDGSGVWTVRVDGVDKSGAITDAFDINWKEWANPADSGNPLHCPARFLASAHYTGTDLSALEGWLASIAAAA